MENFRLEKVDATIKEIIGNLLLSGKIKDHRISEFVTITYVKTSSDLSFAKIGVSCYKGADSTKKSVTGLNSAKGFIQKKLGEKLKTRNTPVLHFIQDSSIEEAYNVNKKLEDIIGQTLSGE